VTAVVWVARPAASGVAAEMQVRSRDLVKAAMCGARANAAPRAGVEGSKVAVQAAGVAGALAGAVEALVGAAAGAVEAAAGAVEAGVDEAGSFYIYLLSLAKGTLRRKYRCFEATEILPTAHRSGASAL
jgi:hypothetical protein